MENYRKLRDILNIVYIDLFELILCLSGGQNYWYSEFFTVIVKMPKIELFHDTESKNSVLSVIELTRSYKPPKNYNEDN